MALTKVKQEKIAPDLDCARSKLDGALQHLMEKNDESPSSSEDESKISPEIFIKKEPSPLSSPTKKQTQRTQRKRKRKEDVATRNTHSYIMKLYDRSVDLAQFSEETPLYPICRAWIHSQPHASEMQNKDDTSSPNSDDKDGQKTKYIYHLPKPTPRPLDSKGDYKDLRIPSPIPQPQEEFNICSDEFGPSKETLMAKHMERWRAIRQKWKQAATANEERFKESGAVLKAIYERSFCREENTATEQWEKTVASVS